MEPVTTDCIVAMSKCENNNNNNNNNNNILVDKNAGGDRGV